MFTTLVPQKALTGRRKNKTALRKIDRFIIKTPVEAEKLISCGEFAREAFICKAQAILGRQVRLRLERTLCLAL